jgi:hypothetical protein
MIQSTDIEVIRGNDFLARSDFLKENCLRRQIFECVHYSASFSISSLHDVLIWMENFNDMVS